jgi:hypothetical protein
MQMYIHASVFSISDINQTRESMSTASKTHRHNISKILIFNTNNWLDIAQINSNDTISWFDLFSTKIN